MALRPYTPPNMASPASNYSHGVEVNNPERWVYVSGQLGMTSDGEVGADLAAQMVLAFKNVFSVVEGGGMTKSEIVKLTVYVTENTPDAIRIYREARDRLLEGHKPAATYVVVSGLAAPEFLVEIEAVAAA